MQTACRRRRLRVGVQSALLVLGGAALAVAEGRDSCLPPHASAQGVAAPAESAALQSGPARSEFAVKYVKGKRGFGGKTEYLVEVAAADGPERVVFKPAKAEAYELVAAINNRSARDEVAKGPGDRDPGRGGIE